MPQTFRHYHNASFNVAPSAPGSRPVLCRRYVPDVALYQRGKDHFAVVYGMEVHDGLTYNQACDKLGAALMHWSACEGQLDNRVKGER